MQWGCITEPKITASSQKREGTRFLTKDNKSNSVAKNVLNGDVGFKAHLKTASKEKEYYFLHVMGAILRISIPKKSTGETFTVST